MKDRLIGGFVVVLALAVAGCAPGTAGGPTSPSGAPAQTITQPTILFASRGEPASLGPQGFTFGATTGNFRGPAMFNAGLSLKDEHDQAQPYLAQTLPQLTTATL